MTDYNPEISGQEKIEEHPDEIVHAARLTVCRYAENADDAAELMSMLGLGDMTASCQECGGDMSRRTNIGRVQGLARGGVCSSCVRRVRQRSARQAKRT